jgi:hypothetical protein
MLSKIVDSPLFLGSMILLLNFGSRYIVHEFSESEEEYSNNIVFRRLAIFAACFVGTRNVVVSILLTGALVIISTGFLRGGYFAREGFKEESEDDKMRSKAGLKVKIDKPAYDTTHEHMFKV